VAGPRYRRRLFDPLYSCVMWVSGSWTIDGRRLGCNGHAQPCRLGVLHDRCPSERGRRDGVLGGREVCGPGSAKRGTPRGSAEPAPGPGRSDAGVGACRGAPGRAVGIGAVGASRSRHDLLLDRLRSLRGNVHPAFPQPHDLRPLRKAGRLPAELSETFATVGSTEQITKPYGESKTEWFHGSSSLKFCLTP